MSFTLALLAPLTRANDNSNDNNDDRNNNTHYDYASEHGTELSNHNNFTGCTYDGGTDDHNKCISHEFVSLLVDTSGYSEGAGNGTRGRLTSTHKSSGALTDHNHNYDGHNYYSGMHMFFNVSGQYSFCEHKINLFLGDISNHLCLGTLDYYEFDAHPDRFLLPPCQRGERQSSHKYEHASGAERQSSTQMHGGRKIMKISEAGICPLKSGTHIQSGTTLQRQWGDAKKAVDGGDRWRQSVQCQHY